MNLLISEVQITCLVLIGMITLFLSFVIDRYTVVGKHYTCTRKILTLATFLVTVHFTVQYWLYKNVTINQALFRTLVNIHKRNLPLD